MLIADFSLKMITMTLVVKEPLVDANCTEWLSGVYLGCLLNGSSAVDELSWLKPSFAE